MDKEVAIIIDETNLNTGIAHKEHALIHAGYYWHKVFVKNAAKYSRDFVLRTIMKAVHPLDFIPVLYAIEENEATFMLKNCGSAIEKMCMLNLTIPHPDTHTKLPPFKLSIHLKFAQASLFKIDIQSNILQVMNHRYNKQSKTLSLENFINDPDLSEFCPLSQSKLLYFVLYLVKDFEIVHLKLTGNELETLKPLEAIHGFTAGKSLKMLDLNRNHISMPDELNVLKQFAITELLLRNNPVCENLSESDYIKLVRKSCPQILRVDFVEVPAVGVLSIKRNFLCDPLGQNFVEQFLEHYFTLYDSHNRDLLINMYHKNAMFSITSQTNGAQSEAMSLRLYIYKKFSRNLKTLSDLSRSHEYIFYGVGSIENVLKMLPETEHDPCSFTVDLLQCSEKCVTITITGVFKEPGQSLLESEYFYGFTRTFILVAAHSMEYHIVNEMLHVTNATAGQQATAFKDVRIPRPSSIKLPECKTNYERNEMVGAFVALTNLVPEWAIKCLKEAEFNLQSALGLFTSLLKADKLPAIAFDFSDMQDEPTPVAPPAVKIQSAESILAQLKPVEKVIQITPTATIKHMSSSSSNASHNVKPISKPVQAKSYIPPKSQPPPAKKSKAAKQAAKQMPTKKQAMKQVPPAKASVKVLQQVTIQPQPQPQPIKAILVKKPEAPKAPMPVPVPVPVPVPPPQRSPPKEEVHLLAPLVAAAVPAAKGPGIVINLQRKQPAFAAAPAAAATSTETTVDNKEGIDTNIADLRNYVNDAIILKVLDMTLETPIAQVKQNLEAACAQVLKQYTCALKYYKAIGREFYRFQLYSDARTFLTNAMATVPKKMGEQLYCIFTLFEIQYGEQNVAENMILIVAESFEINNAVVFLSQELPKTNAAFARKVFGMIAASDLTHDKKAILLKAHIEFEKVFGNVETLKYANKAYQDNCATKVEVKAEVKVEKKEETKPVVVDVSCQDVKDVKPTVEKTNEASVPLVGSQTTETGKELTLYEFRERLLMISNIMPRRIANAEIEHFQQQTDKETSEKLGEELLKKYPNEFYVIRIVCKTWQKTVSTMKVAKAIANIKKTFTDDPKILNPLILYLKVREDVECKNFEDAKRKLFTHIKISKYVQIIQVFEDLLMDVRAKPDTEYCNFLDATLKEATQPKQMPLSKMQLLVAIYTTFCQFIKSSAADAVYNRFFPQLKHYFPEDILQNPKVRHNRSLYEAQRMLPKELDREQSGYKPESLDEQIEEMRMHYYIQRGTRGRQLRNSFGSKNQEYVKQFKLAGAYYEALYGQPSVGLTQLRKLNNETISALCVAVTCVHKLENPGELKKRTHMIFSNCVVIMNPYSQQLLYKYYKAWLKDGLDILDPSLQFHGVFP